MKSIAIDLINKRFGRLIALERSSKPLKIKSKKAYWLCRCDCGNQVIIVGSSLRNKETTSCGCFRNEQVRKARSKNPDLTAANKVFLDYKSRSTKSGIPFALTLDEFLSITKRDCIYCGSSPDNLHKTKLGEFFYNGIDRYDPKGGYIQGNVFPCCWKCNRAKCDMSITEFIRWIGMIKKNFKFGMVTETKGEIKENILCRK